MNCSAFPYLVKNLIFFFTSRPKKIFQWHRCAYIIRKPEGYCAQGRTNAPRAHTVKKKSFLLIVLKHFLSTQNYEFKIFDFFLIYQLLFLLYDYSMLPKYEEFEFILMCFQVIKIRYHCSLVKFSFLNAKRHFTILLFLLSITQ